MMDADTIARYYPLREGHLRGIETLDAMNAINLRPTMHHLIWEVRRLRDGLNGLRRPHTAVCEHLPEKDDHCSCGAAAYNAQIDTLLSENTAEDRYQ